MKSTKIVYNADFGGFSLSPEAIIWLEENAEDKTIRDFLKKRREELSKKELEWGSIEDAMACDLVYSFNEDGIERHHPDLVKCVETIGKENAGGKSSKLSIAKIKGDKYRIDEYDGWESVREPEDYDWVDIEDEDYEN